MEERGKRAAALILIYTLERKELHFTMKSIISVYKIGNGPSSSHTVGPYHAAQTFGSRYQTFGSRYPDADFYEVTLYGSLAFTGEGHGTGKAILSGLPGAKIVFDRETREEDLPHPNTMLFKAFKDGKEIAATRIFSIGGGSIRIENESSEEDREVDRSSVQSGEDQYPPADLHTGGIYTP